MSEVINLSEQSSDPASSFLYIAAPSNQLRKTRTNDPFYFSVSELRRQETTTGVDIPWKDIPVGMQNYLAEAMDLPEMAPNDTQVFDDVPKSIMRTICEVQAQRRPKTMRKVDPKTGRSIMETSLEKGYQTKVTRVLSSGFTVMEMMQKKRFATYMAKREHKALSNSTQKGPALCKQSKGVVAEAFVTPPATGTEGRAAFVAKRREVAERKAKASRAVAAGPTESRPHLVPILSVAPITTAPTAQSPTTAVSSRAKAIEQERYEHLVQAVRQHQQAANPEVVDLTGDGSKADQGSSAADIERQRYEQLVQAVQQHRTERVRYPQLVRAVEQHRSAAKARDLAKRRGAVLGAIESLEDEMTQVGVRGSPSNGTETETSSLPHSP